MLYYFNTKSNYNQAFITTITGKSFIKLKKIRKIFVKIQIYTIFSKIKGGKQVQKLFVKVKSQFKEILCGVAVGAANGLFGGGGGMLAVPLLQKTGLDSQRAHATAILVILPVSAFSFLLYAYRGFYDFSVLVPTAIGVTVGGFLGARLLKVLPMKIISLLFAFLQAFAGLWLVFTK